MADTGIPREERDKIEAAMKRNGIVPTRHSIMEAWIEKQARAPYQHLMPK
jgi:hypothetical protein